MERHCNSRNETCCRQDEAVRQKGAGRPRWPASLESDAIPNRFGARLVSKTPLCRLQLTTYAATLMHSRQWLGLKRDKHGF
jgi:hypothetical protein